MGIYISVSSFELILILELWTTRMTSTRLEIIYGIQGNQNYNVHGNTYQVLHTVQYILALRVSFVIIHVKLASSIRSRSPFSPSSISLLRSKDSDPQSQGEYPGQERKEIKCTLMEGKIKHFKQIISDPIARTNANIDKPISEFQGSSFCFRGKGSRGGK